MAGVFDIDLDQPEEKVSDDEFDDGVSLCSRWANVATFSPVACTSVYIKACVAISDTASIIGQILIHPFPAELDIGV